MKNVLYKAQKITRTGNFDSMTVLHLTFGFINKYVPLERKKFPVFNPACPLDQNFWTRKHYIFFATVDPRNTSNPIKIIITQRRSGASQHMTKTTIILICVYILF